MNLQLLDPNEIPVQSRLVEGRVSAEPSGMPAVAGKRGLHQSRESLLSARECRVLLEISRGASNKQVARLLDISPSTVRTYVESIFRKLNCSTRAAATFKGSALGLIS
ncbi:response regulator transcription factor [Pseudomonas sp. R1-18]